MMTYVGMLLLAAGTVAAAMTRFGFAEVYLQKVPLDLAGWIIVALAGAGLMYFNRRPSD